MEHPFRGRGLGSRRLRARDLALEAAQPFRALLAPPVLFTPGELVRVRVRPGVAELLSGDDPRILEEIESTLGIRVELVTDEALDGGGFEIDRG